MPSPNAMTITEKILARATGLERVEPGQIIEAPVDHVLMHDRTGPQTFAQFAKLAAPLWDKERISVYVDHAFPPDKHLSPRLVHQTYAFCQEHGLPHFYPGQGVCHQVVAEKGHILPGSVVVGADSHSTTHGALGAFATGMGATDVAWIMATGKTWLKVPASIKVELRGRLQPGVMAKDITLALLEMLGTAGANYLCLEYCGPFVEGLAMDERMVLCNMALEMGAKNAVIAPDQITHQFLAGRAEGKGLAFHSDPGAQYARELKLNVGDIPPLAACPSSPDNVEPVASLKGVTPNQIVIGSCTGGRLHDLRVAADILRGYHVSRAIRLLVIPASQETYLAALKEGIIETLVEAGAALCNPNCGPCGGLHQGVLYENEVCLSTTNRNFPGRMGSPLARVYLVSPATAAWSARNGVLSNPQSGSAVPA